MLTTAVLTCALYEHAYIDSFIEHYQKLGFDKIYLLEDRNQPSYEILQNEYTIPIQKIPVYYPPHITNFGKVQLWNFTFLIKNAIQEDWIFLCDIDEFLYLPENQSIHSYLQNTLKQHPQDIGQIQFPWMIVEYSGKPVSSHSQLLQENGWFANDEVKSMIKRSAFQSIPDNHHFHLKHHFQTLHHQYILTHHPKKRYPKLKLAQYYEFQRYPFVIHFHTRGINNIVTKIFTYQYKDKAGAEERNVLIRAIQQNQPHLWKHTEKYKLIRDHSTLYPKIAKWNILFDQYLIKKELEDSNLRMILEKYKISWEVYRRFMERI